MLSYSYTKATLRLYKAVRVHVSVVLYGLVCARACACVLVIALQRCDVIRCDAGLYGISGVCRDAHGTVAACVCMHVQPR